MHEPEDLTVSGSDPVELLLRRILKHGLATALLGGVGLLGCGDIETEGEPLVCAEGNRPELNAAALQTSQSFDSLTVRYRPSLEGSPGTAVTTSVVGTPCGQATAQAACTEAAAVAPSDFIPGFYVVTTRGDSVELWSGPERLQQLLAPIDSPEEATLLVSAARYDPMCGELTGVVTLEDGYKTYGTRITSSCTPIEVTRFQLHVSRDGTLETLRRDVVEHDRGSCIGRIPAGLRSTSADRRESMLGDFLAHAAHLEAASVIAFERLARELTTLQAPRTMVAAALRAAADEVRHARAMGELARLHQGLPVEPSVESLPLRSLEEVALENATEGCVRETYGALVGGYQAEHASEPTLRSTMAAIAEDEARHAALSHRVHVWAMARLPEAARQRVSTAQREAIEALRAACAREPETAVAKLVGLPPAHVAGAMLSELSRTLWSDEASAQPARLSVSARRASASSATEA